MSSLRIKKRTLRNIVLWPLMMLLTYLYVFNPPFQQLPISPSKVLYLILLPIFSLKYKRVFFSEYMPEVKIFLAIIFYTFLVKLSTSSDTIYAQTNIFLLIESLFNAFTLACLLFWVFEDKVERVFFWCSVIASLISVYLIVNPGLNDFVRNSLLVPERDLEAGFFSFRSFGISESLLFTYPVSLGIASCLSLEYAKKQPIYYLFLPVLLVAIMFNARIGFVPVLVYLGYRIVLVRDISLVFRFAALLGIGILLLKASGILEEYEATVTWLMDGFTEVINLLTGKEGDKKGNVDILSTMIIFPKTILGLVFGTGKDVYLLSSVGHSDIGYILQVYYGGIIYLVLLLSFIFSISRRLKRSNTQHRWFNYVFIATVLLCNVKGYFITTNSGMRTLMLLAFIYLFYGDNNTNYLEHVSDEEDINRDGGL